MEILRLQNESNTQHDLQNTLKHWDKSRMYDDKQINAIKSSNHKSEHQPTSVPSPFARIALVKTAFTEVAEYGDKALVAYQRIVSDTLDIAEIFFTYDKWRKEIEIIKWDKEQLDKLKSGHRQIYDTLKMFLDNDALSYNFDKMEGIYILKHKNTGDMIGATSPSTLFFSTSNNFNNIDIAFSSSRKAFTQIAPLNKRNWDFQKYLYTWIAKNNDLKIVEGHAATTLFREFNQYLNKQKTEINRTAEIDALSENASAELESSYKVLRAPNVEILGKPLYQSKEIIKDSLTADDLLEDTIIRLPYEIKKESFFNGNIQDNSKSSYLLPIKSEFFKYYTLDDLKNAIKINHSGDVAEVDLKIDNQQFKKHYKISDGSLIQATFDCALFPNVKFKNEEEAQYRFGLVCDFKNKKRFSAEYIRINTPIDDKKKRFAVRNENRAFNFQMKNYSLEGSNFDYIEIKYDATVGIIVPNLKLMSGEEEFTFAVDFGTTNTHIEYKKGKDKEKVFDISQNPTDDRQVHWLHGGEEIMKDVFDEEFLPAYTDEEFKLPMRTALSFGENVVWHDVYPFEKASLDELYEKRSGYAYNETITDLKWSDNVNNQNQVKVYIESLMFMLRNKVVLNYGNLGKTKIKWFYPASMERNRFNNLKSAWSDAYIKYFGEDLNNIVAITESVAPFEYYIRAGDSSNLVTIDIGGGTTDIVVSKGGEIDYITSFRFAANSIFGDGYAEAAQTKNGIIRQFFEEIRSELEMKISNKEDDLFQIFDDMKNNKSSADIASFLFSLKHNKTVMDAGEHLAKNANLESKLTVDTTQKIIFVFFYASIIYHLAKVMKAKGSKMPDKIVFSGNGSRAIPLFTDDSDILEGFTKKIFEKVYDNAYSRNELRIILNKDNPKEATCKGGFYIKEDMSYRDILMKTVVLHSNGTDSLIERKNINTDNDNNSNSYNIIDDKYIKETVEENRKFIQLVFDLLPFFDNEGYKMNKNSIAIAKDICFSRLDIYADNGWRQKKREIDENDLIEETLFFYPIVGMLKQLTDAIYEKNNKE